MFDRDCVGHLRRHGIDVSKLTAPQINAHFEQGPKTAAARPGDNVKPLFVQAKTRRRMGAARGSDDDEPTELDDDLN